MAHVLLFLLYAYGPLAGGPVERRLPSRCHDCAPGNSSGLCHVRPKAVSRLLSRNELAALAQHSHGGSSSDRPFPLSLLFFSDKRPVHVLPNAAHLCDNSSQ